jgi:hypothetical protein
METENPDMPRLLQLVIQQTEENTDSSDTKRIAFFRSQKGIAFADISSRRGRQSWPVRSEQFKAWLSTAYFEAERKFPSRSALESALSLIDVGGLQELPIHNVFIRVGRLGERLYLDLGDESSRAIEVDADGWRVTEASAVRFLRTPGMLPLPIPQSGGSIEMLRSLVNLSDEDFVLVVAWLLGALNAGIPKPILAIRGAEGSAKSSLVEIVRGLVDPHDPPYVELPRTELKFRLTATGTYCVAFDNVSSISLPMSDALCRFVTDGSNQPAILNGLSDIVARPDLSDRCLFIDCPAISDQRRRSYADVMSMFADARAKVLGVLLDAVVHGLQAGTQLEHVALPRMADFACWITACETKLWPASTFSRNYDMNRIEVVEGLISGDPVAAALRLLIAKRRSWVGQATELDGVLRAFSGTIGSSATGWPAEPRLWTPPGCNTLIGSGATATTADVYPAS